MLRASIYIARESGPIMISALHRNDAGIFYELEIPIVLPDRRDTEALGASVRACIEAFSPRDRNLREAKLTDWPAYRVSGCRSVRQFEDRYVRIAVRVLSEAALLYDASAAPHGEKDIALHVTLTPYRNEEIGRKILRLFDACSKWSV